MVELAALPAKPENSVAWLYRVVRHRALNNLRSQARRAAREKDVARSDACQMDPSINMQEDDERARITNVLDGLSAEQRELVVLRIWSGLGWREIEDLTGVPSSTAHRRYTAALETMKRQLETKCPTNPS